MTKQVTNHIMMIRPVAFHMNEQTAVNNYYQKNLEGKSQDEIQDEAKAQFDGFVSKLRSEGVDVTVIQDTPDPSTPDSIFPNNWISFHEDGMIRLYPMYAENRRLERRDDIIDTLKESFQSIRYKELHSLGGEGRLFGRNRKFAFGSSEQAGLCSNIRENHDERAGGFLSGGWI